MKSGPVNNRAAKLALWRRAALAVLRVNVIHGDVVKAITSQPCVVICNHVSLLDGVIIALASPTPMLFPVNTRDSQRNRWTRTILRWLERRRLGRVVPLDTGSFYSIRTLRNALLSGESVCIFPEGKIADTQPSQHHLGYRWLADQAHCQILAASIAGAENSVIFAKHGTHIWPSITLRL